jgi:L-aspartate oxidase
MTQNADILIVGSGLAGLAGALKASARGARVLVVTAGAPLSGSSKWAQGGIAAAVGPDDSPALHALDTESVGAGTNDTEAVRELVERGRDIVLDLWRRGLPFQGGPDGPDLALEAGHSRRRVLHAVGGATGEMLSAALVEEAQNNPRISIVHHAPVSELLIEGERVIGVRTAQGDYFGGATVLATGGYGALWYRTTNPLGNRGFGHYLAWMAGAALADMEFVQFHPTALLMPGRPAYLLSEALRGDGALLLDEHDREIVDPLLPRDVVARAIAQHRRDHGPVFLSMRHLDAGFVRRQFAAITEHLQTWGLDLATDPIPVAPAAHYCMGGVRTDLCGRTGVAGLYAAGEVACTGAQGANRLASNSMLECLVYGERAAESALDDSTPFEAEATELPALPSSFAEGGNWRGDLSRRLDTDLGVERDGETLRALVADLPEPNSAEIEPDALIASLAARSALLRTESRGAHYRTDYPGTHEEWQGRILWQRGQAPRFEPIRRGVERAETRVEELAVQSGASR